MSRRRGIAGAAASALGAGALAAGLVLAACGPEEPLQEPVPLSDAPPFRYPIALWDLEVEGETLVRAHVTALGEVDSAFVEQTSGHAAFDSAAVEGVLELRFSPARRGGRRVSTWVRLPVRFQREAPEPGREPMGEEPT